MEGGGSGFLQETIRIRVLHGVPGPSRKCHGRAHAHKRIFLTITFIDQFIQHAFIRTFIILHVRVFVHWFLHPLIHVSSFHVLMLFNSFPYLRMHAGIFMQMTYMCLAN